MYFFFREIVDANHSEASALRDWLHQLLPHSASLQLELLSCKMSVRDARSIDSADLWRYLMIGLTDLRQCFIIADALDEMAEGAKFASALADMASARPQDIKAIATSRPVPRIQEPFQRAGVRQLRLDEQHVDVDIAKYVQHSLQHLNVPAHLHERIRKAVPGKANGLFLYARLAMDAFSTPGVDPEAALASLQTGLGNVYTTLLRKNAERAGILPDLQRTVLQFITHTTRPLRLLELAECLAHFGEHQCPRDIKQAKDLIRASCGHLLEILPNETISIIHHSLTEFLTRDSTSNGTDRYPVLHSEAAHMQIALKCMGYIKERFLMKESFDTSPEGQRYWQQARDNILPADEHGNAQMPPPICQGFGRYACVNWQLHASKAMGQGQEESELVGLLDYFTSENHASLFYALWPGSKEAPLQLSTPLSAAVCFELGAYLEVVLGRANVNFEQLFQQELLIFERACALGRVVAVRVLLEQRVEINKWNADQTTFSSPLIAAAYGGSVEVVQLLLQHGADANLWKEPRSGRAQTGEPWSLPDAPFPLQGASNSLEITRVLLPLVRCARHVSAALGTAIQEHQHVDVVKHLCEHPLLDVNRTCHGRSTPIALASRACNDRIVQHLLELGADPNLCPPALRKADESSLPFRALEGWALGTASGASDAQISQTLRLLIEAGADLNKKGPRGMTPLHIANDVLRTKLLLGAGADDTRTNDQGRIPLFQKQIEPGQLNILFDRAVSSEKALKSVTGESSMVLNAVKAFQVKTAIRLIRSGLTATARDADGNTALHYAVNVFCSELTGSWPTDEMLRAHDESCVALVKLLCHAGISVNARNSKGQTPLHVAGGRGLDGWLCSNKYLDRFRTNAWVALLDLGADIHAECNNGETPLLSFARLTWVHTSFNLDHMEWLVGKGASPTVTDHKGRNLIFAASYMAREHKTDTLDWLVNCGVDATHCDDDGNTVYAAFLKEKGGVTSCVFDRLVALGVDTSLVNKDGRTPLHHFTCSTRHRRKAARWDGRDHDPLSLCNKDNIDLLDKDGNTPLQLAITHNEQTAKMLLEKGANVCITTAAGENPFHAAAKHYRVDLLVSIAEAGIAQAGHEKVRELVNALDTVGRSPLFYAFQSGRAESIHTLVSYGAEQDTKAALGGCAVIETGLTRNKSPSAEGFQSQFHAVSERFDSYPVAIDEVLAILGSWGPSVDLIDEAVETAADHSQIRAVYKLLEFRTQLGHAKRKSWSHNVSACLESLQVIRSAYQVPNDTPSEEIPTKFDFFLAKREHTLAIESTTEEQIMRARRSGYTLLHDLARGGYTAMLSQLLTPHRLALLDEAHARRPKGQPGDTLLMAACRSQQPNMGTLRLLVETFQVDVNSRTAGPADDSDDEAALEYRRAAGENLADESETALHVLAKGASEWHGSLAVPYLCARGAKPNVLDRRNISPLEYALHTYLVQQLGSASAVRELLRGGATTQPLTPNRASVFLIGDYHVSIAKHLFEYTATYDSAALMCAIRGDDEDAVQQLLAQNVDPNQPQLCSEHPTAPLTAEWPTLPPLYWAYCRKHTISRSWLDAQPLNPGQPSLKPTGDLLLALEKNQRIIDMLLASGADPNARVKGACFLSGGTNNELTGVGIMSKFGNYREGTFPYNSAVISFLQLPNLGNLNELLLRACRLGRAECFETLLDRGADILARDADGRNALHALVSYNGPEDHETKAWNKLCELPELVYGASNDGSYPIHRAVVGNRAVFMRLIAGGQDPWVVDGNGQNILHILSEFNSGAFSVEAIKTVLALPGATAALHVKSKDEEQSTPVERMFGFGVRRTSWRGHPQDNEFWQEIDKVVFDAAEAAGADFRALNSMGQSLLHLTARTRSVLGFQYLLDRGLDPRLEDNSQRTPLDIAAEHDAQLILDLFK